MSAGSASCSYQICAAMGLSNLSGDGAQAGSLPVQLGESNSAGALKLDDAERPHEIFEVVDLVGPAGQHHGQLVVADVDDGALEDLHHLDDLAARGAVGLDRDEAELALDRILWSQLADLHHVDELEQLLGDLLHGG